MNYLDAKRSTDFKVIRVVIYYGYLESAGVPLISDRRLLLLLLNWICLTHLQKCCMLHQFCGLRILESYRDHYIRVEFRCDIMKSFPLSVIVDTWPGKYRPQVIKLPIETTHSHGSVSPECLDSQPDPVCLHAHRKIGIIFNVIWLPCFEDLPSVLVNNFGSTSHFVVVLHRKSIVLTHIFLGEKLSHTGNG